jgi:hypothetical protein
VTDKTNSKGVRSANPHQGGMRFFALWSETADWLTEAQVQLDLFLICERRDLDPLTSARRVVVEIRAPDAPVLATEHWTRIFITSTDVRPMLTERPELKATAEDAYLQGWVQLLIGAQTGDRLELSTFGFKSCAEQAKKTCDSIKRRFGRHMRCGMTTHNIRGGAGVAKDVWWSEQAASIWQTGAALQQFGVSNVYFIPS